jgi:phage terminase large subunit-like protein
VFVDELWAHKNPELYYALTTGQLARLDPLVVSITTAGWDRDSIAWQVYERGRTLAEQGEDSMRRERFLFRWFEAPPDSRVDDPNAWAAANPSSWIDPADLAREARRLPEPVFRRLHLNEWTDTVDSWVSAGDWDACRGEVRLDDAPDLWEGVDIGVKRDSSAIVEVGWVDRKLHCRATVLTPKPGEPVAVADVRERVATMGGDRVRAVVYDPHSFRESAQELEERGLPMVEFPPNNARMVPASEKLYELIRERRLVHDGRPCVAVPSVGGGSAADGAGPAHLEAQKPRTHRRLHGVGVCGGAGQHEGRPRSPVAGRRLVDRPVERTTLSDL